jgi:hypothetical protein
MQDLAAPICPDLDPAVLEEIRVKLLDSATKMAAMKHHAEANQSEIDRIAGGTPAAGEPSRAGAIRQRGAAIACMLGVGHVIYDTPVQNLRAAQAAAEELKNLEGDERQSQLERLQELLNAANTQQDTCNRIVGDGLRANLPEGDLPPRREYGATLRSPSGGGSNRNGAVCRRRNNELPAGNSRRSHDSAVNSRRAAPRAGSRRQQDERPPSLAGSGRLLRRRRRIRLWDAD